MNVFGSVSHRQRLRRTHVLCILILLLMTSFCFTISMVAPYGGELSMEPTREPLSVASMELVSTIRADSDDDYWNLRDGVWTHISTSNDVFCREYSAVGEDIAQFRFQLQIPQGAVIHEATIAVYETSDNGYVGAWIRRINETNVGPLESYIDMPKSVNINEAIHIFDRVGSEWTSTDITKIVGDQVELPDWQAGFYIGLQFNLTGPRIARYSFEDYQSSGTHHAYVQVKYSEETSWLTGWSFRKSSIIRQTIGAGTDFTIPISVSMGSGTDYDSSVNLDGKALPDFTDIRFTTSDGDTQLDYYLQEVIEEQTIDYFTDVPVDFANFPGNYPGAFYYNGRTYVVFQGDLDGGGSGLDPHIMYYDHASNKWSGVYYIGYNPCPLNEPQDDHGSPCLWVDSQGYINILYGAHNYNIKYARSQYPEDIRSWILMTDPVTSSATYPHINYDPVNNVIHLIYRTQDSDRTCNLAYKQSADEGLTWSSEQVIMEFTTEFRWPLVGVTDLDIPRQMLHFGVRYRNGTDAIENDEDIYYMQLDVTSGHLFNANGYDLGTKVDEKNELPYCKVYESGDNYVWGPAVHIDADGVPYLMFIEESIPEKTWFTYWDRVQLQWMPIQQISSPGTIAGGLDFIVHSPTNITAFVSDNRNIQRYSWDGSNWTWKEELYDSNKQLSFSLVPVGHHDEIQVVFCEYEGVQTKHHEKMFAWGSDGLVSGTVAKNAIFYVKIPFNLDKSDQVIYIYYGNEVITSDSQTLPIADKPRVLRGPWGIQEAYNSDAPTIDGAPVLSGMDTDNYLYARAKVYSIALSVSDVNGISDINYVDLTPVSETRTTDYWTVRYYQDTAMFVEYRDPYDYVSLDATSNANISSGNTVLLEFKITINWNHPDILGADVRCSIVDDQSYKSFRYYNTNWNVETRLDLVGEVELDDGRGTPDRGDINGDILASGSIAYYGSSYSPPASEIDVYVVSTDVSGGYWRATDYEESRGTFTVTVNADNNVGKDVYRFKVVPKSEEAAGFDLLYQVYTRTYIADCITVILFEDEDASNDTVLCYSFNITYAYDDMQIADFSVVISKNGIEWLVVNSGSFTDQRNITGNDVYTITAATETLHGLTRLKSSSWFIPSGDGSSSESGMSPEAVIASLREISTLIGDVVSFMGNFMILIADAFVSELSLSAFLYRPQNIGAVLICSLLVAAIILGSQRSRWYFNTRTNRRK